MKGLRSLFFFTLIAMLVLCSVQFASADSRVSQVITQERGVSLRSSPEKTETNKICGIHANVYLDVLDEQNGWFYVYYEGQYGWVSADSRYVRITEFAQSSQSSSQQRNTPVASQPRMNTASSSRYGDTYDMGVPYIGNKVFRLNMMNMVVYWVQVQMKATGVWYQGEYWDVTGNLGDHTMEEIRSFMQARGYGSHTGVVDQRVIDELANYLGSRLEPVYVGGFYDAMNTLLTGDEYGTMYQIVSNMRDGVARESVGARWVQVVLKDLGYYSSSIDGKYGEGTEAAVMKFQREHGFQERDYVSLGVARSMLEQYYGRGGSIERLP